MIQTIKVNGPTAGTTSDGWLLRLGTWEKVVAASVTPMNASGVTLAASANMLGWTTRVAVESVGKSGNLIGCQIYQSGAVIGTGVNLGLYEFCVVADGE